jgi:flavin-dependent dehydrogenase
MNLNQKYDIIIVGAGPVGIYLGSLLAKKSHSVMIVEKDSRDKTGSKMDQFHLETMVFKQYDISPPDKEAEEFITDFKYTSYYGPDGKYQQIMEYPITALRFKHFIQRLIKIAENEGVNFSFSSAYKESIVSSGTLIGIKIEKEGQEFNLYGKLIIDSTGSSAAVRRSLPNDFGVENFKIEDEEKMYVIQRVIKWKNPEQPHPGKGKYLKSISYLYYKTWIAPHFLPNANILGGGQPGGYENQEKAMKIFLEDVPLPPYEIIEIHKDTTAYRRSPLSLVGNGFFCIGDSACMSKSFSGEAIESSWEAAQLATEVIDDLLGKNLELTQNNLWPINVKYFRGRGAKLTALLAQIPSAANLTKSDVSYLFKHDIIFSGKDFQSMWENLELNFSFGRLLKIIGLFLWGLITNKFSRRALSSMLKYMKISGELRKHYENYPEDPREFDDWEDQAIKLWEPVEKMRFTLEGT